MGKIVQPLLIIAAIAVNVIPGVGQVLSAAMISAITTAGITAAVSMAATAVSGGTKSPAVSAATRDRLYATIDPATPRKLIFGETAMATDIRYEEWNGANQEYLDRIICAASHRVTDYQEIYFDDKLAWTSAGGAQGEFAGYLTVTPVLEGNAGNYVVIGTGSKWGASRRLTGCAYLQLRYKVTGNDKKKESPFAQAIPSRVTIIGRGMPVYDPRFDSTRGGSGTMRANDQTTWAFTYGGVEVGRNPANQMLTYLLGWRINGLLAVGRGLPVKRIDFDSFITAANACDEPVVLAAGGTEPRYRTDGIFSEADDPRQVIDTYEASMNAKLRDAGGRFSLTVLLNDLATPRFAFDDNDVLGEFKWTPAQEIDRTYNEIRGKFTNPSRAALFQLVDYPRYREPPADGIERVHPFDLALVQSGSQAQRLAKQQFARNRYQGRFEATLGPRGWAVQLGDVVTLSFSTLGWENRLFRVVEHGMRFDGVCPVVLQEENANIYLWDADERPLPVPVQPVPYDQSKSVLMQLLVAGEIDYSDGQTVEALQPAESGATNSADPASPFGPANTVGGALAVIDSTATGLSAVQALDAARDASARQLQRQTGDIAEALMRALTDLNLQRTRLRDAGMTIDPATGQVRIYAVDTVADRVSKAEVRLNGVDAQISLRATTSYVNEQIALAVFDPTQVADLADLFVRVGSAEVAIDGLEATVLLKADAITVTGLSGIVTNLGIDLDALEGVVALKANSSVVTDLGTRVTNVETTLTSLGDTVGITSEIRQARYAANRGEEALLRAVLAGDAAHRSALVQLALIQNEMTTKIVDDVSTEARARLALTVRMAAAESSVTSEQLARIAADGVLASNISAVSTTVGAHTASIAAYAVSINGLQAKAGVTVNIDGRVTGWSLNSGADSGDFDVLTDRFRLIDPDTNAAYLEADASGMRLDGNLNMGDGAVVSEAGGFRMVRGAGFGPGGNLLEWFGPVTIDIADATVANSVWSTATDGVVYYGGTTLPTAGGAATPQSAPLGGTTAATVFTNIASARITVAPGTLHLAGTAALSSSAPGGGDVRFELVKADASVLVLATVPLSSGLDIDYDFGSIAPIDTGISAPAVWTLNVYARRTGGFGDVTVGGDIIWHM